MRARELVRNMLAGILEVPSSPTTRTGNDDGSLCSTLTADVAHTHKPLHESADQQAPNKKKRVSFHPQATLISRASPHYLDQEEIDARWYAGADYVHFKQTTSTLAKTQGASNPKDQAVLLDLYSQCSRLESVSDNDDSEGEAKNPLELSKPLQSQLQELFLDDDKMCIIGLERPMARFIHKDKYARRLSLVHVVYDVQEYALNMGESAGQQVEDELRQQCMALSQPSRLFAQHLAQAQYEANQSGEHVSI